MLAASLLLPLALPAQQADVVAGVVVDASTLNPLGSVQVGVEGTQLGATTDAAGRFRLTGVSGTQVTLQLRRLGFRPTNEVVRVGRTDLRLTMSISPAQLNEVVITGTAEPVEKRALGNAVAKIDASEVQMLAPSPNASSLFNGRAPGVVMIAGSGAVGSGPRIRIRGSSSISLSDQPLIYVDGIRVANDISTGPQSQFFSSSVITRLNDLDPDDIESIEIVKGPAAATLYGTEANNGVIQIITKRGKAGRPVFTAVVRNGSNWYNNAEERIGLNFNRDPVSGAVQTWNPVATERSVGRKLFKTGKAQNYNMGVNGGTDAVRYNLNASYDNETGIEPTNGLWRGGGSANISMNPRPNFDINASVGITRQNIHVPLEAGGGMWFSSYFGQAPRNDAERFRRGYNSAPPDAFWAAFENYQGLARTTGSLAMNHRFGTWFSQRLTVGNDLTNEDNVGFTERMGPFLRQYFTNPVDQLGGKQNRKRDLNVSTVDYAGTVKAKLFGTESSTSFGAQYFRRGTYIALARGEEFPTAGLETVDATARNFGGEFASTNSTLGFYMQEQVNLNDRLYLTGAVRVDDNSAFGENFSWITYPKVGASWVIGEEPFFKVPFVSSLKLRAAYGHTGQQPATFSALRTYAAVGSGEGSSAVTPSTLGNADLKAERAKEIEVGFDAAMLNERIGLEVTGYQKSTEDAIVAATVAPSSGFPGTRLTNLGEIRNRGIEIQLRANIVQTNAFSLDANVNFSKNENKVLDVGAVAGTPLDQQFIGTGNIRHQVGYPVGAYWDRRVKSAEFANPVTGTTKNEMCDDGKGGVTACFDAAGNIVAPRVFYSRTDPSKEGSFSTTATLFRRFRFFSLVDFKGGNLQFDNNHRVRCQAFRICLANLSPTDAELQKYGQTRAPATLMAQYNSNNTLRDVFMQPAGYAKLREISLSYVIPETIIRRGGFTGGTLTLSGRNLKTWSHWTGVDPESFFSVEPYARTEQAQTPPLQSFLMSFSVNF
ncbi:MAG TPA: SusC/RagA family TonB-linked outer membrane protein [Gemmatimonadaceae bacterium]|nr:SusC/RagA family TonB-linked outer membrane protein [Gemmatimonadaceae bacterium]